MAEHELNKIVDDDGEVFNLRDSTKQPTADRVTSWSSPTDAQYPSAKLVKDSLDAKAPSAITTNENIATNDRLLFSDYSDSGKIKRKSDPFDTSITDTFLSRDGTFSTVKEADVRWGGAFRTELSPIEFGNMARNIIHNPLTTAITFEKTTDGGTTWVLQEISDNLKRGLCNLAGDGAGANFGIPSSAYSGVTDPSMLKGRITLYAISSPDVETPEDTWFYCQAKRVLTKVSRSGTGNMKVEYQTWPHFIADDNVWGDAGTYAVAGDSGWNSIPFDTTVGGYSGQLESGRIVVLRFTFWISAGSSPRIAIINLGILPQIHWKTRAGNIPLIGVPMTIQGDGTGIVAFANKLTTARKLKTNLARTADSTFDGGSDQTNIPVTGTLPLGNGGTGATTAIGAEYNILNQVADIDTTINGDRKIALCNQTKSASNGVFRWLKLSNVWTWIKGLLSSESGVNISGSSASCTGNAATASAAQSGSALETAINGKMNTSASNATAPSSSGGDGATATLLNNLTDGNSDIVTTDDGDNVLIATTDNGGSVTNKWYKRKLVKLIPWIIKKLGTRLVYDCGAGSTSGDDFDAALAAFNAGQWVIIHKDGNVYYCVGTFQSSLRFRKLSNSGTGISVSTLNWTRESAPTSLTQLDASLSGHTHTRSDVTNFAHTHGNIQDGGALQTSDVTIASGDKLVVTDSSDSGKVARASASFDGSTTTKALTQKGTFATFMTPSAGNAASGALQNLTGQLTEGTSDFTDKTEIFTSYAGNNGFAESGHVNQPYRRKASSMLNYVRNGFAIDRSPADVGTAHKRISLGYGKYNSSAVGAATYLVHLFFNYADDGGLQGKGISVLVTYDFRKSSLQKAECRILSDNGVRDSGYNIVLANYVTGSGDNSKLYICIGLVKNSAPTTLVAFAYSYCKIFKLCTIGDWTQDISSDAVSTYDYIIQATDLVSAAVNADMVDGKHIVIGSWAGASNTIYFG